MDSEMFHFSIGWILYCECSFRKGKGASTKTKAGGGDGGGDDDFDAWMKSRQLLKPDDQLELTEAELAEEITKVLTVTNTNVLHNLVVYSFKEGTFVNVRDSNNYLQSH